MSNPRSCRLFRIIFILSAISVCFSPASGAPNNAIPVVSRVSGSATVTTASGASHELGSVEPLQSGATITTALDSIASVAFEQVGHVQLGPQTKVTVSVQNGWLSFQMASGSLCVESKSQKISVGTGTLRLAVTSPATIYDILDDRGQLKIAVYRGGLVVGGPHTSTTTIYAGSATLADSAGRLSEVPISTLTGDFAKLKCPDADIVSEVAGTPTPAPATASGGHGGTIIATLLGLAAIAVAVGHGSGGGGGSSPAPAGPFGAVAPLPTSLNLRVSGANSAINVSESNYTGLFGVSAGSCGGIAGISPLLGTSFTVSPVAVGNCRITFSDDHGQSAPAFAFVTAGTMFVSPQILQLTGTGNTGSFTVSDSSPTVFSATSSNLGVATVTLVSSTPTAATFTVTAVSGGTATIMVTDTLGGAGNVSVGVGQSPLAMKRHSLPTVTQPLQPTQSPVSLQRPLPNSIGQRSLRALTSSATSLTFSQPAMSQSLRITERGYAGSFSVMSDNPGVATTRPVLGMSDTRTILVTAISAGKTFIRVADDHGGQILITVTVLRGQQDRSLRPGI